jgi:hypothetical protein
MSLRWIPAIAIRPGRVSGHHRRHERADRREEDGAVEGLRRSVGDGLGGMATEVERKTRDSIVRGNT